MLPVFCFTPADILLHATQHPLHSTHHRVDVLVYRMLKKDCKELFSWQSNCEYAEQRSKSKSPVDKARPGQSESSQRRHTRRGSTSTTSNSGDECISSVAVAKQIQSKKAAVSGSCYSVLPLLIRVATGAQT